MGVGSISYEGLVGSSWVVLVVVASSEVEADRRLLLLRLLHAEGARPAKDNTGDRQRATTNAKRSIARDRRFVVVCLAIIILELNCRKIFACFYSFFR